MSNSRLHFALFIMLSLPLLTSTINEIDLLSLLAFKEAIHDPFGALTSWNASTHFCSWKGIQCGHLHPDRVVAINLISQGLLGPVSPSVGNISFIRVLNLKNNSFIGNIPDEVGRLRRLKFVDLSNNSFSGPIPRNLSHCSNLVSLNLVRNLLSGTIPPDFNLLHKIKNLGLGGNNLSGHIPPSIGNLTFLRQLSLLQCNLIGEIPESLGQLRNLKYMMLSDNNFKGQIPAAIFNISTILVFDVGNNLLQGSIPSSIGSSLPNMVALYLGINQFSGQIPTSLSNASSLELIYLSFNNFTGHLPILGELANLRIFVAAVNQVQDDINVISTLVNCTNLENLEIGENLLSGELPNSIANFSSSLDELLIQTTLVQGQIPHDIGNLVGLSRLSFAQNNLDGPIPSSIGKLSKLGLLALSSNRLTSELPNSLSNLTSLISLSLDRNQLYGNIPKSFNYCTNLLQLDLSHNNLSGSIPPEIFTLSSISIFLDLSNNLLVNTIPSEVHFLTHLTELDLSNNKFSGVITNSLGSCTSLLLLHLEGNLFEGEIPHGLSSLKGLQDLDLSRNRLSGSIPSFLAMIQFEKLNLSYNGFQGEVPMHGAFANQTVVSLQGNDHLCGGIPELKLPPCPLPRTSKTKIRSLLMKILIPIGIVLFICMVIFLSNKGKHEGLPSSPPSIATQFLRLSYVDIVNATSGFSETNLIGSGRFGHVYKGILSDGKTQVAVKVFNLLTPGVSKSLMAECTALRHIRHRNIMKILSVCESVDFRGNDFKALVYDYKENGNLERWLYPKTKSTEESDRIHIHLSFTQKLNISIDIAHALEYLHCGTTTSVVHGDLKPSNILLDHDLTAYIGDFGLAKIIPSNESSSSIGIKGTIGYVPPEYGTSNMISLKGDVYSYGILLLEIFTNKRPTDHSFGDCVNLHDFVHASLQDFTMDIVDSFERRSHNHNERDCMASVLSLGIACSKQNPMDHLSISDTVNELHKIKNCYFN